MIKIRYANLDDEQVILNWKNDDLSVLHSQSKRLVSKKDHKKWFSSQLEIRPCPILIAQNKEKKIGMIRFDKKSDSYIVSINLNPDFRGRGLGSKMLLEAEKFFFNHNSKIIAYVDSSNLASIKLFEKCGYNQFFNNGSLSELAFAKNIFV